ncbi:MAG: hypothetical protein AAF471_04195 [Myxococcota bacterium]
MTREKATCPGWLAASVLLVAAAGCSNGGVEDTNLEVFSQSREERIKKCRGWRENLAKKVAVGTDVAEACKAGISSQQAILDVEEKLRKACDSATGFWSLRSFTKSVKKNVCSDFTVSVSAKCPEISSSKMSPIFFARCLKEAGVVGRCVLKNPCEGRIANSSLGQQQACESSSGLARGQKCEYEPPKGEDACVPSDFSRVLGDKMCNVLSPPQEIALLNKVNCISILATVEKAFGKELVCADINGSCAIAPTAYDEANILETCSGLISEGNSSDCESLSKTSLEKPASEKLASIYKTVKKEAVETLGMKERDFAEDKTLVGRRRGDYWKILSNLPDPTNLAAEGISLCKFVPKNTAQCVPVEDPCMEIADQGQCEKNKGCRWK